MKYTYTETQEVNHEIELESCPLCGSDDIYVHSGCREFDGYAKIGCNTCGIAIEETSHNIGYGDTVEGLRDCVISKWNTRIASEEIDARIKLLKKCLGEAVDCIEAFAGRMGVQCQLKLQPDYIRWKGALKK